MRLKEKEKEAKKEEILQAARKFFSEKGFEHTSMDEIAKKVKIAKGTIYLYFDSKQALLLEILNFAKKITIEKHRGIIDSKLPYIQKLKEMIQISLDFTRDYPEYGRIFHSLIHQLDMDSKEEIAKFFHTDDEENLFFLIKKVLVLGVKEKEFKQDLNIAEESFRIWALSVSHT
ncbi:MAG TPA: hypothetical protein DHW82_13900, partial [Spirochaetia bacterium]|nr:hypothetical protein [Spirochaetia bacterium]